MNIFLSYSSAQRSIAERLALSLLGQGHTVFYDRSAIEAGSEYDGRIREAIEDCELFVFLISPEAVAPGSYPLAEIGLAEKRWRHPAGHVLPIVAQPVPIKEIPPYLRAVSLLEPRGDFVAESSAAVAEMSRTSSRWRRPSTVLAAAVLILFAWFGYSRIVQEQARQRQVASVIDATTLDIDAGRYEMAFDALSEAFLRFPENAAIRQLRNRAAMLWLRNIRVRVGERTFTDVVNKLSPVLSAEAVVTKGAEAGDLLSHLGWGEYLRARDGEETDPVSYFRRAVDVDKSNPYAHAMWGFWILFRHGSVSEAASHFSEAMTEGRDRQWVGNLQIAALLSNHDESLEAEAIRVTNAMHKDQLTIDQPERLWPVYQTRLLDKQGAEAFVKALPAGDQAATFQWLYPEASVPEDRVPHYRFMLGRLQEVDGNRDVALSAYRWTANYLKEHKIEGRLQDRVLEGIQRLTKP